VELRHAGRGARRYSQTSLRALAERCGFRVRELLEFNRIGTLAARSTASCSAAGPSSWGRSCCSNALTPLFRRIDRALPVPSLSLIAIFETEEKNS
jgi:hypothetical protein